MIGSGLWVGLESCLLFSFSSLPPVSLGLSDGLGVSRGPTSGVSKVAGVASKIQQSYAVSKNRLNLMHHASAKIETIYMYKEKNNNNNQW